MVKKLSEKFIKYTAWADSLMLILTVFACTFFIYKDFNLRMLYGYAVCGLIIFIHCLRRIILHRAPHFNRIKVAYFVMVAVVFICFLRPDSRHDVDTVSYSLSMIICSLFVFFSTPTDRELKATIWVLTAAAVFFSLYTLLFTIYPDFYWKLIFPHLSVETQVMTRYYVPRGYSIPVGGSYTFVDYLIALALPLSLAMFFSKKKTKWVAIPVVIICYLYLAAAILIGRRGEMLSLIGAFGLVILFSMNFKNGKAVAKRAVAGVLLFVVFGLMLTSFALIGIAPRYKETVEKVYANIQIDIREREANKPIPVVPEGPAESDPSAFTPTERKDISSGRMQLWEIAWDQFIKHPVIGIGWGGFADQVSEEFNQAHAGGGQQNVVNVHNCYLQFLCETGIIGGALILVPFLYIFILSIVQMLRSSSKDKKLTRLLSTLSFGGLSFFHLVSILDMSFYQYKFWAFYGILILSSYAALERDGFDSRDYFGHTMTKFSNFINRLFSKRIDHKTGDVE